MAYETILYSVENGVATIQFNRPETMNAQENKMIEELEDSSLKAAADPEVGALIITGSGRAFSAGGDLKVLEQGFNVVSGKEYLSKAQPWLLQFVQMEKPVIAAVNGLAVGAGFSIALLCDFIYASDKARFAQPFIHLSMVPDIGAMYFLPRLIGLQRAKEIYVTGRQVTAQEGQTLGFVNRVLPGEELMGETRAFAEKLASGPRVAIKMAKKIMNLSLNISLESLLEYESYAQSVCFQTEDHKEGVKAFFEKRPPKFKGS